MLAPALALAICSAYAASLWWLLRRESAAAMAGLVALTGVALAVRIWSTDNFPAGLIEDEPKMLRCAQEAFHEGRLYDGECVGMPLLFWTVFQAQLVPLLGPTRWAVRSFSLITGVLSVPAAYAVGRGLLLSVAPSLGISALVACLPWSIFYGRIALGGELIFHELLLLAALVRLMWASGSWPDILVGSVGLCGLLHDYFCGRAMAPMTIVAAVLARGRYRLFCVAVLIVALIGWMPYVTGRAPSAAIGFSTEQVRPEAQRSLFETLRNSTAATLRSLVPPPFGRDSWFTVRAAGVHPPLLLALAVLGSLNGIRGALFLWAAFLGGLAPSILSEGQWPSAHRMMMAFPVIAIAVGCALNLVPKRLGRALATLVVVGLAAGWGVRFYFSPVFWSLDSRGVFSQARTDVVESLPPSPHPHFIVMHHLGYYFGPRAFIDSDWEPHTADNWVPKDRVESIYVFDPQAAPLRPFYEHLVGTERVRAFEGAFTVALEARDWSWIKQHGWVYTARCGDDVRTTVVPAFYFEALGFAKLVCSEPITHTWHARWRGAATSLRLYLSGEATVQSSRGGLLHRKGEHSVVEVPVQPGDEVRVTLVLLPPDTSATARVMEITPAGERVPLWESADPILGDGDANAAPAPDGRRVGGNPAR